MPKSIQTHRMTRGQIVARDGDNRLNFRPPMEMTTEEAHAAAARKFAATFWKGRAGHTFAVGSTIEGFVFVPLQYPGNTFKIFKYHSTDPDRCRVYYRSSGSAVYCLQYSADPQGFDLFSCTAEGEPSHPFPLANCYFEIPRGDAPIDNEVIQFINQEKIECS